MKTLRNPWFIVGCLVWLIVQIARMLRHPVPWLNGYITDLFAVPVIANLGLWMQRVFIIKSDYYVLSRAQVIFIVVYMSLLFEWLLPMISKIYTADWKDVLLYCAGGLFFYFVMNKPLVVAREKRE
jgi:hypothetical protein